MESLNAVHMSLDDYIKVKGLDRKYEKPKDIFSEAPKQIDFKNRNMREENDDDEEDGDDDFGDDFLKDVSEVNGLNYMKADFNDVYSKSLSENSLNTTLKQWQNDATNNANRAVVNSRPHNPPRKQQFSKKANGGGRNHRKNYYFNKNNYNNKGKNGGHNGYSNGNYGGGSFVKNNKQMRKFSEKKSIFIEGLMTAKAKALVLQKSRFKVQQQSSGRLESLNSNSDESISQKLAVCRQSDVFNIEKMPLTQKNVDTFAGNFMNFLNSYENVVHKPVYDLKIQGHIAELQKKVVHCTNTGTIMPQSGLGIECEINPHASATPLAIRHC